MAQNKIFNYEPLTITSGHLTIAGAGDDSTLFMPTNAGDTFLISLPTPGAYVTGVSLRDFRIYRNDNINGGVALHYIGVHQSSAQNIRITGAYGGVWCESCITSTWNNVNVVGDNTAIGAFGYMFSRAAYTGAATNSEVFVSNFDVRALHAPSMTFPIYVENADGIFFSGGHMGFSSAAAVTIQPAANDPLDNLYFSGCEFDNAPQGVYIAAPAGYTANFGQFVFAGSAATNNKVAGFYIDPSASMLNGVQATGMQFVNQGGLSTSIGGGVNIQFGTVQTLKGH
jgi:hypothetical protein